MDVKNVFSLFIFSLALTACSDTNIRSSQVTESFNSPKCTGSSAIENEFIVQWEDGHFSVEKGEDPETFREEFVKPRAFEIRHVQINQKIYRLESEVFDTGDFSQSAFVSDDWGLEKIQASDVWAQGFKGQGVKVGIIDSQVDVSHSQLRPRVAVNENETPGNGIDDDRNGVVDDYLGAAFFAAGARTGANEHGSHVAGIVAADPNTGSMSGVAPESQIIPSAFLDDSGSGSLGNAILAMQYAASRGAKIINASWGGTGCDHSLVNAMTDLDKKGVLLVVAAGNSGLDIDVTEFYPAAFELAGQITVGASNSSDIMPTWSNNGFKRVHLTAPGEEIVSTGTNNGYLTMDGTSMAAPFVAGAAAVLWSAKPEATSVQIKQAILSGVDVISGKHSKTQTRGRLNLSRALDELRRLVP